MKPEHPKQPEQLSEPPLIFRSDQQSRFQRYGFRALTILFWLLFLYLFRIALTPVAWLVGAQSIYELISYKVGLANFIQQLGIYASVVVVIGVILVGWARYNQLRFSRCERRIFFLPPVSVAEQADFFQVSESLILGSSASRRQLIRHSEDGHLQAIDGDRAELAPVQEPFPLQRFRFQSGDYQIYRRDDLRWVVVRAGTVLHSDSTFAGCREYLES